MSTGDLAVPAVSDVAPTRLADPAHMGGCGWLESVISFSRWLGLARPAPLNRSDPFPWLPDSVAAGDWSSLPERRLCWRAWRLTGPRRTLDYRLHTAASWNAVVRRSALQLVEQYSRPAPATAGQLLLPRCGFRLDRFNFPLLRLSSRSGHPCLAAHRRLGHL
jgi:hypothetical protein